MNTKTKRAMLTFVKYALWTGAGAAVSFAVNYIADLHMPSVWGLVIGGALKTVATYVATEEQNAATQEKAQ